MYFDDFNVIIHIKPITNISDFVSAKFFLAEEYIGSDFGNVAIFEADTGLIEPPVLEG